MTIYFCIDDRGGLLFNGRRLSRDGVLLQDMASQVPDRLTIDPFSEKLIASAGIPYTLTDGPVPADAHFFLECRAPEEMLKSAQALVLYRWNRVYPSDVRWLGQPADFGFILKETTEFPGKSHEKITKEVYIK